MLMTNPRIELFPARGVEVLSMMTGAQTQEVVEVVFENIPFGNTAVFFCYTLDQPKIRDSIVRSVLGGARIDVVINKTESEGGAACERAADREAEGVRGWGLRSAGGDQRSESRAR